MRYGTYEIERRPRKCRRIDEKELLGIGLTKVDIARLRASRAGKALLRSYLATSKQELAQVAGKRGVK